MEVAPGLTEDGVDSEVVASGLIEVALGSVETATLVA